MSNRNQFKVGGLVFAKVPGYSAWPAKITKYNNNKTCSVIFFGTKKTAAIKVKDMLPYLENKEKFNTINNLNRVDYIAAIERIEAAMNGEEVDPVCNIPSDYQAIDADTAASNETMKTNEAATTYEDMSYEVANETQPDLAQVGKQPDSSIIKEPISQAQEAASRCRNGPQIRRKRNFDEVMDPNIGAPPAKERNLSEVEKVVKSFIDYKKPDYFKNEEAEQMWMKASRKNAEKLKLQLEYGFIDVKNIKDRVIIDPPLSGIPTEIAERFKKSVTDHEAQLLI